MNAISENEEFLTTQIITYLGNKRSLIGNIQKEVIEISQKLGKKKLVCADLFSGSTYYTGFSSCKYKRSF